jgi:hypothetical protein
MCVLRVTGKNFDADLHLLRSGLSAGKVFRAGEPRSPADPDGKRFQVSGFNVDVSYASWDSLSGQVTDAIAFLKRHEEALKKLRAVPSVDDMRLDFPVDLRIDRQQVMVQFDYFPPELVTLAGGLGLGLEISIYPPGLEEPATGRSA